MLFVGLVLVSGGLGAAGMRRDSLDCTTLGGGVLFPLMHGRDWAS